MVLDEVEVMELEEVEAIELDEFVVAFTPIAGLEIDETGVAELSEVLGGEPAAIFV